jgi:hypothetical protein
MPPQTKTSVKPVSSSAQGRSARKAGIVVLAVAILTGFLLSTGVWKDLTAGPKKPLPRSNLSLGFGSDLRDVLAKFPGAKDRSFNNDPMFRILSLKDRNDLPENAAEAELIFFEGKLYFTTVKWENESALAIPVEAWAREYRRWLRPQPTSNLPLQTTGGETLLQEWYFDDSKTEMVLRNLKFNDMTHRWVDLRDGSNAKAQAAFRQYRFDLQ